VLQKNRLEDVEPNKLIQAWAEENALQENFWL
jgi:hypothetical protein